MPNLTSLTTEQIEKIQIDEGVIYLDYGETSERVLAPTRGGGEFGATVTIRDIDFDGKVGKTAEMQVIEEQAASLKVTSLCMSQSELALAIPGCRVTGSGSAAVIKNPVAGVIPAAAYLKNVTMFAKTIGGEFKKITIYNPMNEAGLNVKAVQKAEGELALEFIAHYGKADLNGDLWKVEEVTAYTAPAFVSAVAESATKVKVTFSHEMSATGLVYGDFSVKESDVAETVSAAAISATDAHIVELTVATLAAGTTVTVSYTKGTAKDTSNNMLNSFTNKPVLNSIS